MENVLKNYNLIKQEILKKNNVKLVAVSKTFPSAMAIIGSLAFPIISIP